jgi:glycosyltransferase involved in cell wall biosynthesis
MTLRETEASRDMPKVAFVLPSYAGGGAERVVLNLIGLADRARFLPTLVVLDPHGPLSGCLPDSVPVIELGHVSLRASLPALVRTLRRLEPEFIFSTFTHVNLPLLAARPLLRRARLVVREANLPSANLPRMPWPYAFRKGFRQLYPAAHAVIASSRCMRDELIALGVPSARISILHNPVDDSALRRAALPLQRMPGPGLRFVASGRLHRQKGFDRLIDVMDQLPADSHLTILGDGPERTQLEGLIQRKALSERVSLRGFVADPAPWIAGADAFVMPSRFEGMPNAALEALALGTPVIATPEAGGVSEIDAVQIAEFGAPFVTSMLTQHCGAAQGVRPSKLPSAFQLDNVARQFSRITRSGAER